MKATKHRRPRSLTATLYLAGALLLLLSMAVTFAADTLSFATGRLHPQTITLADTEWYTLVDLAWDGADTLTALSGDVQIHLQPGQPVRYLRLEAAYSTADSYERDLYWHLPGRGYSPRYRVWPNPGPDGVWEYTVPLWAGQNLRLDLADQSGAEIRIHQIVLNEQPVWYTYFIPTLWQLLWLAIGPGLLACGAALAQDAVRCVRHKKEGGPHA